MTLSIEHGGALDRAIAAHGGTRADWLDLSTGINRVAYPMAEVDQGAWRDLPDEAMLERCLDAARTYYGIPHEAGLCAAPGTQAILQWLPQLAKSGPVGVLGDTYGEYARCAQVAGRQCITVAALPTPQEITRFSLFFVCNPNNPDGTVHAPEPLAELAQAMATNGGVLVVDEAFGDVSPASSICAQSGCPGLLVLRSFGKFFGLAGLRLGFAAGEQTWTDRLAASFGPWAVSGPALAIGARALADAEWIAATRARLAEARGRLEALLGAHGLPIKGGTDLFVLTSRVDSLKIANSLAMNHILVRQFALSETLLRFGIPADEVEFERLEKALTNIVSKAAK